MKRNRGMYLRRGSVYVLVLSTSILVAAIGLGALQAVRVERRSAGLTEAVVQARTAAVTFIEVALLRISNDPAWRSTYTHDVWSADETIGNVTCTFKLVDEEDTDLADDATQPVRLHARATVGAAQRTYSILLQSNEDMMYVNTLPVNGDMESGVSPWYGMGCNLDIRTDDPPGGAAYLRIRNRDGNWDGPRQDISSELTQGVTYEAEVWVKMKDYSEDVRLVLWMDTDSAYYSNYYAQESVGTDWTKVSAIVTPTWSGALEAAYWEAETSWSSQEFKIDEAIMRPLGSNFYLSVVPGSWRREVL